MTKTKTAKKSRPKHRSRTPDDIWRREPELIRRFLAAHVDYQHLCTEVEYILRKRVAAKNIEVASISSRAKTLNSFLEKIQRKEYDDPLEEITDFAGVRVVCLYASDVQAVGEIIAAEFDVVEKTDKVQDLGVNEFGYTACHHIVRLGKASSGARYDDLKSLRCEIQVRTVVQDAWAILQHHLVYKREAQVPTSLQRKLNSLAGLFETVDDQFEHLRQERAAYLAEVRGSTDSPSAFLDTELNLDTFGEFLKWRFPDRTVETWKGQSRLVFDALRGAGLSSLREVDGLLKSTEKEREAARKELDAEIRRAPDGTLPSNLEPGLAVTLAMPSGKNAIKFPPAWDVILSKYRKKPTT